MLSIFIMFSRDRVAQLEQTISCLRDMPLYDRCQKTLVIDEYSDYLTPDFAPIYVPRIKGAFSWSNMWAAGVATARYEAILYLDSDRLLPPNYLQLVVESVRDNVFVFTSRHFMLTTDLTPEEYKDVLADRPGVFTEDRYLGAFRFEPRFQNPIPGPGKNVMSGNTAFTKSTFVRLGGVDGWYRGHGAFADTDFHMQAALSGCEFLDLDVPELHCKHPKLGGDDAPLGDNSLQLMALDNFIYFCNKWKLPKSLAEALAFKSGVTEPRKYVRRRLKEIIGEPPADGSK